MTGLFKFQRISYTNNHGQHLGEDNEELPCKDAEVIFETDETFPESFPIYKISKRIITSRELKQVVDQCGITEQYWDRSSGNKIDITVSSYPERESFWTKNYSDEQLEELAWTTFRKVPFLNPNEYEYVGITSTIDEWKLEWKDEGYRIESATVSFRRILNGYHIIGNDVCSFTFDGSGLKGIYIAMYAYKQIGTMDLIPLQEAEAKITSPDYFSPYGIKITKLCVKKTWFLLENQYSNGCTVLQPVYRFVGPATLADGREYDFYSIVIAVPKYHTYEKPWWRK